ncbi:MAG: FAD-dependent oxidoreductase [Nitriliruptoraceae bacterium]|nr:FAD-dependent oxidoreductase [Nitriliruptoraceae bacterium]
MSTAPQPAAGDHADVSFWLETSGDDLTPRPPLTGDTTADVVVVGAGFSGLWTARELLVRDPGLEVVVLESQIAGFGASGRNGAWLAAGIAVTPTTLAERTSPATVRAVTTAMRDTVEQVLHAADDEGLDIHARRSGILRVARGRHEVPHLTSSLDAMRRLGIDQGVALLDVDALAERIHVADAHGAMFDPYGAAIHPGRLVRGLARAVERRGATIHEGSGVRRIEPRGPDGAVRVTTDRATVRADAVVVATEAWTSQLPGRHRDVLPVYSLIVLTEPIDDTRWARIGWAGHELLSSHRMTVDYLSRTLDGRVLFGGRGAPYHLGSRIAPAYDQHAATHALLRDQLTSWFPDLAEVGFSHAWGGPLAMPRDWMPSFAFDAVTGVGQTLGYTGQGVATSNLGARVVADLIVHGETPFADLPMVGHRSRRWEPEPLRWLGARYLQGALARVDARAARTGRPRSGRTLAERLIRH